MFFFVFAALSLSLFLPLGFRFCHLWWEEPFDSSSNENDSSLKTKQKHSAHDLIMFCMVVRYMTRKANFSMERMKKKCERERWFQRFARMYFFHFSPCTSFRKSSNKLNNKEQIISPFHWNYDSLDWPSRSNMLVFLCRRRSCTHTFGFPSFFFFGFFCVHTHYTSCLWMARTFRSREISMCFLLAFCRWMSASFLSSWFFFFFFVFKTHHIDHISFSLGQYGNGSTTTKAKEYTGESIWWVQ